MGESESRISEFVVIGSLSSCLVHVLTARGLHLSNVRSNLVPYSDSILFLGSGCFLWLGLSLLMERLDPGQPASAQSSPLPLHRHRSHWPP